MASRSINYHCRNFIAQVFNSSYLSVLNTNKKNPRHKWTERDEACFGETIKPYKMMKEFDFEKNLALFDKKVSYCMTIMLSVVK